MDKRRLAILGATGSIGTQALEVVREHPGSFEISVLTANRNVDLLIRQALEFRPRVVVIGDDAHYKTLSEALSATGILVQSGPSALKEVVQREDVDLVLTAMVGASGLEPTMKAIDAGKDIALANKETLVIGGQLVMDLVRKKGVHLLPVDSEHSAIFQCLSGENQRTVEKIYLTASGGPFRGWKLPELENVTVEQALKHPNWSMGAKITIDSASMMNKGLEVIEAKWLFDLKTSQIDVVVHPQSIIHSMVQFHDGSIMAQMGLPDMKLPIQHALTYPQRQANSFERLNFMDYPELTFQSPDTETFRNLALAFEASERGGNLPCILNAANEVAVDAFLKKEVGFLQMSEVVEQSMHQVTFLSELSLDNCLETDQESRRVAREWVKKIGVGIN